MANTHTQLEGVLMVAVAGDSLVDVSSSTSEARITRQRNVITVPANLANAEESDSAGTRKRVLNVKFHSSTEADSFAGILRAAIETDESLVDWSFKANDDAISSDNPLYSGTAMVPQVEEGGVVGALREQSIALTITTWNAPDVTP